MFKNMQYIYVVSIIKYIWNTVMIYVIQIKHIRYKYYVLHSYGI